MSKSGNIITPGEFRQKVEANAQGGTVNPFSSNPMMEKLAQQEQFIDALHDQVMALTAKLHALMDYMGEAGMLLHSEIDPATGQVAEGTKMADNSVMNVFRSCGLEEAQWPRSYDAWASEHFMLTKVMRYLNHMRIQGRMNMTDLIAEAKKYNEMDGRFRKILGHEFGLDEYLGGNPDNLTDEQLKELAAEFGLVKIDIPDEEEETVQ